MNQNKIMSWSAAVLMVSFFATAITPMVYSMAASKYPEPLQPKIFGIELFSVAPLNNGGFTVGFGLGTVLLPVLLSLFVWGVLQISTRAKRS